MIPRGRPYLCPITETIRQRERFEMQNQRNLERIDRLNNLLAMAQEIAGGPAIPKPVDETAREVALEVSRTTGIELANKIRKACARRNLMVPEFWT